MEWLVARLLGLFVWLVGWVELAGLIVCLVGWLIGWLIG